MAVPKNYTGEVSEEVAESIIAMRKNGMSIRGIHAAFARRHSLATVRNVVEKAGLPIEPNMPSDLTEVIDGKVRTKNLRTPRRCSGCGCMITITPCLGCDIADRKKMGVPA